MKPIVIEVQQTIAKTITPKAVLDVQLASSSTRLCGLFYDTANGEDVDLEAQGKALGDFLNCHLSEHAKTGLLKALHARRLS